MSLARFPLSQNLFYIKEKTVDTQSKSLTKKKKGEKKKER
jgi:hypothetical protein